MTVGIMRSLRCNIEQRCIRNPAGECADSWGEGDRLFDRLERSHYDELVEKVQRQCQAKIAVNRSLPFTHTNPVLPRGKDIIYICE